MANDIVNAIRSAAAAVGDAADAKRTKLITELTGDMLDRPGNPVATINAFLTASDPPMRPLSAEEREAVQAAVRARRMPKSATPAATAGPPPRPRPTMTEAEALEVRVFSVPLPVK
jgi:hypothetical protein